MKAKLLVKGHLSGKSTLLACECINFFSSGLFMHANNIVCILELQKKPLDWFSAGLVNEDNIFKWEILIIGPTDSL